MSTVLENLVRGYSSAIDSGKYADRANRYAIRRLGGTEGNETIIAAMVVAQAIRDTSADIVASLDQITEKIGDLDVGHKVDNIEEAIKELVSAVDNIVLGG